MSKIIVVKGASSSFGALATRTLKTEAVAASHTSVPLPTSQEDPS